jgi:RNA polymerase sigma-70 factor (ECF subfamily)
LPSGIEGGLNSAEESRDEVLDDAIFNRLFAETRRRPPPGPTPSSGLMALQNPSTHVPLLHRLRSGQDDPTAWNEFVAIYGPLLVGWCRRWGLQEADAEDVAQAVLLRLSKKMKTFCYEEHGSFHAYLKTLARYALIDFLDARAETGSGDTRVLEVLRAVEARADLMQRLHEQFDRELLDEAMRRVQDRVEPHTWEAFRLAAIDGLSGADVADRLGIKVGTVFKARSKVQRMLREELLRLDPPSQAAPSAPESGEGGDPGPPVP